MICIAVALARVLPVLGPAEQLTEYGPARGETVNGGKHLGTRPRAMTAVVGL
jgi:hypothetical protein